MGYRTSIFDSSNKGADLSIENGGVVITTDTAPLDINRTVFGTLPQERHSHAVEFIVYGTASSIANKVSIGVSSLSANLNAYVGSEDISIGYRIGDGAIYRDGSNIETVQSCVIGDVIRLNLEFRDQSIDISWYRNGQLVTTYTLDTGSPADVLTGVPLVWAVSLGSELDSGDIKVFVNSGRRQLMEFPDPSILGWWTSSLIGDTIRISDEPFITLPTDTPSSTRWEGLITDADILIDRAVHFWPWGDSSSVRGGGMSITVDDPDGLLDGMLNGAYRDQPVTLHLTDDTTSSFEDSTLIGGYVVERVQASDETTRVITCRDALANLEKPLLRRYIRPDAAPDAAFRPYPIVTGACFSVEPILIDETELIYAIDSIGLSNIGKLRDAGDPLENTGSPTTYTLINGGQAVQLAYEPFGILTIDAEYTGSEYVYSDGSPPYDALLGDGYPFSGSIDSIPDGWSDASVRPDRTPEYAGSGIVTFPQYANSISDPRIVHSVGVLEAGKTYQFEIEVVELVPYFGAVSPAIIYMASFPDYFNRFWSVQSGWYLTPTVDGGYPWLKVYTGTYSPSFSHSVYIGYYANNTAFDPPGQPGAKIRNVRFIEVPELNNQLDDDIVEEALQPAPLGLLLREIIEIRGGFPATIWNQASADSIDAITGYSGQGFYSKDQVTVRDAIDSVLNGYTASAYLDRNNILQIMRLRKPEDEAATKTLTINDMVGPPIPTWDEGLGLSRLMGVRRNERLLTDTDLVTDEADVTLRLRRKLARQHRYTASTGAPLASGYEHADAAGPVDTRLVKLIDGVTEINRIGDMYVDSRSFWRVETVGRSDIDIDDVVNLTYPRFGLESGVNFLVVGVKEYRLSDRQIITLWGLSL